LQSGNKRKANKLSGAEIISLLSDSDSDDNVSENTSMKKTVPSKQLSIASSIPSAANAFEEGDYLIEENFATAETVVILD
jgi:hypothetical protein